jgi:LacI family transcriptional regulator, galactose operon repressor
MNIKEIAKRARVSIATVSRTINAPHRVHPDTARRVRKVLEDYDYYPNLTARALVTGRTNLIGLVVPNLIHSFFAEISQSLSRVLRDSGYSLLICSSDEDPEIERQTLTHLLARGVDALLIATVQQDKEIFPRSVKPRVPYVLVDRRVDGLSANFVGVDDEKVGFLATEHLIEAGCRRIAHIGGVQISTASGRLEGYKRALKKHQFAVDPEYIVTAKRMDESADSAGYYAAMQLLALKTCPDGIFCYNDPVAIGAMRAILENGMRIPENIALIGSGNLHLDTALRVPLSTVDQQCQRIGECAASLAVDLIGEGKQKQPKAILLVPKVVVRESSRLRK